MQNIETWFPETSETQRGHIKQTRQGVGFVPKVLMANCWQHPSTASNTGPACNYSIFKVAEPFFDMWSGTVPHASALWVHKLATAHPNFLYFIGYAIRNDTCESPT